MTHAKTIAREAQAMTEHVGKHSAAAHIAIRRYLEHGDPAELEVAEKALRMSQHHLTRAMRKVTGVRIDVTCRPQGRVDL